MEKNRAVQIQKPENIFSQIFQRSSFRYFMSGRSPEVAVFLYGFCNVRGECHHLDGTHRNAAFSVLAVFHIGQAGSICLYPNFYNLWHSFCPEIIAETADLLFEFTESTFYLEAVCISFNDPNGIQGKVGIYKDAVPFSGFNKYKTEFLIKFFPHNRSRHRYSAVSFFHTSKPGCG